MPNEGNTMSSVASTLLDFILNLLRDPETAGAFARDPQGTLEDHGLGDITSVDIEDIMPVLMDASPSSFDRMYDTGGNSIAASQSSSGGGGTAGGGGSGGGGGDGGGAAASLAGGGSSGVNAAIPALQQVFQT